MHARRALFPPFAAYESVEFGEGEASRFSDIELPVELERAAPKRKLEFAAGRHCARLALGRLLPGLREALLPIGAHRAPVWPPGTLGAITHSHGFAAAAVATTEHALGIGLDTEQIVAGPALEEISAEVATPEELRALHGCRLDPARLLTTVFSAKESIFKCLYPQVGRYFDFQDVTVVEVEELAQRFTAQLQVGLGRLARGTLLEGRFVIAGGLVHTAIVLPALVQLLVDIPSHPRHVVVP